MTKIEKIAKIEKITKINKIAKTEKITKIEKIKKIEKITKLTFRALSLRQSESTGKCSKRQSQSLPISTRLKPNVRISLLYRRGTTASFRNYGTKRIVYRKLNFPSEI